MKSENFYTYEGLQRKVEELRSQGKKFVVSHEVDYDTIENDRISYYQVSWED